MSIGNSQSSTCIVCRSTFVRRATINCCVVYRPHSTTPLSTPTPTSSWGFFRGNRVGRVGEDPREDVVVDIVECGLMPAVLAVDCYSTFRYLFSPGLITVTDKLCILLLAASPAIQAVLDAVCCHRCCTSVCLSVCWLRPWALQKRLNHSRCRLGQTRITEPWRIRLDGAAVRPVATTTLTTCYYYVRVSVAVLSFVIAVSHIFSVNCMPIIFVAWPRYVMWAISIRTMFSLYRCYAGVRK